MTTALVVEDSITDKEIVTSLLQRIGVDFIVAQSVEEAAQKIKSNQFDLVVLDIILPDGSGFEICRDLKEGGKTKSTPILMCSTKKTDIDKFWGMKQGADAYLAKPINQDEFVQTVKDLIAKS